jgi:cytoskeletal protein RodZ
MSTFGEKLRSVRLEKGVSLEAISEETKISHRYLEALERLDHAVLPGTVFARNFARQYARVIGWNPADLDSEIRAAFPPEGGAEVAPALTLNQPLPIEVAPLRDALPWNWGKILTSTAGLIAVLLGGALVTRVWQEAPQLMQAARDKARQTAVQQPAASSPVTPVTTQLQTEAQTLPASLDEQPRSGGTTITISGDGMAVQVTAEQDTWVSMTANGTHVFSELLKANQSKTISGVANARMVIGNAGGVKIATDGKDIGPIGKPGQVRVVMLSPEGSTIAAPAI